MAEKLDVYKELYSKSSVQTTRNRMVSLEYGSLAPESFDNFNKIANKYPNISKDLIMSMVKQGLTVDTPGIGSIVSVDGITKLKNDMMNVDNIKKTVAADRGVVGQIGNAFNNTVYAGFKTATRVGFAGIRSIYDLATVSARNISTGNPARTLTDPMNTFKSTLIGSLVTDVLDGKGVDTGNGFFVDPKSKVGKDQAKAMQAYGKINGESFTIGRWAAKSMAQDPDTTAYKIMSGAIDAVLNVALDPTIWVGPGSVGKIIQTGKKASELKLAAQPLSEEAQKAALLEKQATLRGERKELYKTGKTEAAKQYKRIDTNLHKTSMEIAELEKKSNKTLVNTAKELLDTEKTIMFPTGEATDKEVSKTLSTMNVANWFSSHEKVRNGELTRAIDTLAAESKNTGGFFRGKIFLDEVPEVGKISVGAQEQFEYVITARSGEKLNLLDLGNTFLKATQKEVAEEATKRAKLVDKLRVLSTDSSDIQDMQIFQELSGLLEKESANLEGFYGSLFSVGDEVGQAESLGSLIGRVAKYKSPEVMDKVRRAIEEIWKVDGFTNIRSIYGETGGVVVTNNSKIGAKGAEIAIAAAEVADPTNLGPNLAKLLSSIKDKEEVIARRQNEYDDLVLRGNQVDDRLNYIYSLRQAANKDPEILKELINDPDYKGLKKILNIEVDIAEKTYAIEALRAEAGLVKGFGGEVTKDFDSHLKWLLGKRFSTVAEIVAKETDPVRVHNLFNGKLDLEVTQALTDAQTSDDVLKVLLNHVGGETVDPRTVRNAVSNGLKLQASPLARMVDPVNLRAVKFTETVDRIFGRDYVRGTVLSLGDGTGLLNGVANWVSSAGIKSAIGLQRQEALIAEIQRDIFKATTNQERGAAVANGIDKIVDAIGENLALDSKLLQDLKKVTRISGKERAIQEAYSLTHAVNNTVPHITVANGETKQIDKALMEWQAVQDFLFLPDTKEIYKSIGNYKANYLVNRARAGKVLLEEFNDFWRTAQLVGRFAYITRNIAEMQMRQMLSGHNSLFNNPLGFISTIVANPEGGAFRSYLAKYSKFQYDAGGNAFKTQKAEADLGDATINFRSWWNRNTSASDIRSGGSKKKSQIFNMYTVVGSDHPDFIEGLSYTVNNFVSDKFMSSIVRLKDSSPEMQRAWLDNLAKDFDKKDNPLRNFAASIFNQNIGLREIYLKDVSENGPGVVKDNLNLDDIFIHLFDSKQADSIISQINAVAGTGPKSQLIYDLIRDGEITVPRGDKLIKIKAPYSTGGKSISELDVLERDFLKKMNEEFTPEDMVGSTVFVKNQEFVYGPRDKASKQFVDWFFDMAARAESKLNFGPEFQMAYWDFAAGYASLLKTDELIQFRANAVKSLAPVTKNGKKVFGRRHPALREINKEIAKREKNPSYTGGTASIKTIDQMASREASNYVKGLFYDAGQQKQYANAVRLIFPFAQAHYNTLSKWAELSKNPAPAIKFAKAYDALNKEGSNVLYDISGVEYDPTQGFFYQDTPNGPKKFKMPIVGTVLGAMAGKLAGVEGGATKALQMTSPVQSLNLAFGQVNPGLPGIGVVAQGLYTATGKSTAFGPVNDILRDIITPFGAPKSGEDFVFPAWLKKTIAYRMGDEAVVQRGVKDWAAYLASTGNYGDNPLASDAERNRMFADAEALSREVGFLGALFQSISAATPQDEVLAKIKDPNNKLNFMTMTMLYDNWQKISDQNPGDYGKAVSIFADTYGVENLLVTLGSTTPGVRGTDDAWTWLNNHPDSVSKYAKAPGDVIPYFFPGGEYSLKYYNWQKRSGARRALSTTELANEAESRVYSMLKSQIANEQIANGYGQIWYTEQIAKLDNMFGGSKPASTITTGAASEKIASIKNAIQDPAFKESPVYKETAEFYNKYADFESILNKARVSNYAELTSKGGLATMMRNELLSLAEKLMLENPSFSRMYYGVFAGQLEG